ncbi:MAG: peptide MFS transporter [Ignavibacteria bacterium]|nr:peptide MFS transporter [Ignavibacteria bacterium]
MFEGHPKGLKILFFTEMWERFGFYTMLAVFVYYLQENFKWDEATATNVYGIFLAGVYFTPVFGGWLADNILGYGKTITIGAIIMCAGYALMATPTSESLFLYFALAIVALGNGLFKANISVLVGNLYGHAEKSLKDAGFNIFYMGINVGAFFAPFAASGIKDYVMNNFGLSLANGYNAAFGIASAGMIISVLVFLIFRKYYISADYQSKNTVNKEKDIVLTPKQEKDRILALITIFGIVIFFWMAFHQNGAALSLFARDFTHQNVNKLTFLLFDVVTLVSIIIVLLGIAGLFNKKKTAKDNFINLIFLAAGLAVIIFKYLSYSNQNQISPEEFQSFNPMFIVLLTPLLIKFFGFLNKKEKEPSSPAKIGIGMFLAGISFLIMMFVSFGLPAVHSLNGSASSITVSPFYLIGTYFMITIAELHLSPMGLSFVSKVAPPKLKGLMMGGWFGATAIGNYLSGFVGRFYQNWELWQFFLLLVVFAFLGAVMIRFALKKLKAATE